ncbi:MAG: Crp/Fnr family transcriptional regulator [Bacteroidetes bacterium]|nr:Crp/Fnr family transcriptional regulator [Bacteroidota bacterium]
MEYSILSRIPLFRGIPAAEIENIFENVSSLEKVYKKGAILAEQDEACNRLIILLSGKVRAEMADPSGKVVKVEDILAPNPLAILFLFGTNSRFPVQATADEDCTALVIPKQSVLNLLGKNELLLKNYLDISADFASRLSQKLYFMSFRTIRQKISMFLLELSRNQSSPTVEFGRTKSSLSEYFGVSRPSLERELSNMQHDGWISIDKKEITILKKESLVQLVRFGVVK